MGTRKSLCAARELTRMRFLSSVCAGMSCLMFEALKGFIADRALVRSW
jgi:hypothetical protein